MSKIKIVALLVFMMLVAVVVTFNVNLTLQKKRLSDLALANIEALARNESGDESGDDCGSFYKNHTFSGSSYGLINSNGTESCSLPCPNVTTNGVYGDTYKCHK